MLKKKAIEVEPCMHDKLEFNERDASLSAAVLLQLSHVDVCQDLMWHAAFHQGQPDYGIIVLVYPARQLSLFLLFPQIAKQV